MTEAKGKRLREAYADLTPRRLENKIKKLRAEEEAQRNQKPVKRVVITIEWKKSRTWGWKPAATAGVFYADDTFATLGPYKTSGCGYDKTSTVVAAALNDCLLYLLYRKADERPSTHPYGIYVDADNWVSFNRGVGMSCYPSIAEFLGIRYEHLVDTRTVDVFTFDVP